MAYECVSHNRRFGSQQALQQHLDSPAHNLKCDEYDKSFGSQQQHLDSLAHIRPTSPTSFEYIGIPRSAVSPVFATARKLRFQQPTVKDILRRVETELDHQIVAALISAALRLLPIDNTPDGNALRTEETRIVAAQAKHAEDSFCVALRRRGLKFLRESQQRGRGLTPDVLFKHPTLICGHLCSWLEYKDFFGFRGNPFIAIKNKRKFRKYATQFGPGAVIYKLGFETDHVNIDGVMTFREKEVLQDLGIELA